MRSKTSSRLIEAPCTAFYWGKHFEESYVRMREKYPDLDKAYEKFVNIKTADMNQRNDPRDYQLGTGGGNSLLRGIWHCHFKGDALLLYKKNGSTITMLYMAQHEEITEKRAKSLSNKLAEQRLDEKLRADVKKEVRDWLNGVSRRVYLSNYAIEELRAEPDIRPSEPVTLYRGMLFYSYDFKGDDPPTQLFRAANEASGASFNHHFEKPTSWSVSPDIATRFAKYRAASSSTSATLGFLMRGHKEIDGDVGLLLVAVVQPSQVLIDPSRVALGGHLNHGDEGEMILDAGIDLRIRVVKAWNDSGEIDPSSIGSSDMSPYVTAAQNALREIGHLAFSFGRDEYYTTPSGNRMNDWSGDMPFQLLNHADDVENDAERVFAAVRQEFSGFSSEPPLNPVHTKDGERAYGYIKELPRWKGYYKPSVFGSFKRMTPDMQRWVAALTNEDDRSLSRYGDKRLNEALAPAYVAFAEHGIDLGENKLAGLFKAMTRAYNLQSKELWYTRHYLELQAIVRVFGQQAE